VGKIIKKVEAIEFLGLSKKEFENYLKNSKEIIGQKIRGRWYFDMDFLNSYKKARSQRIIKLSVLEYERCFEFAIKMVYGGLSLSGIRGQRSEVQAADDVILGILGEYAVKKFFKKQFDFEVELDNDVHTSYITPQDIIKVRDLKTRNLRIPKLGVGIKASKLKSGFLVLGANEVELANRKSDVYIFTRIGLHSDHLFRILRDHSFFAKVTKFLNSHDDFRKIEPLFNVPIWICGYVYLSELEKVNNIPGQDFDGYRYVKSVADMHNKKEDWEILINSL